MKKIDYPLISAVGLKEDDKINIGFSGICEVPFRSPEMEETLNHNSLPINEKVNKMIKEIPYEIQDDTKGSAEYRKFMMGKIIEKMIEELEAK